MPATEEYEILILGSGESGKSLAWSMAKQGKRTAVVERRYVGGSCPNIACLPSKNVIHSAKVASYFRRGEEFGIVAAGWTVDMAAVRRRKREMVDGLVAMHLENYRASGAELVMGEGRFIAPKTMEVSLADGGTRILRGQRVFLNTGSRALLDDIPGLREAKPMTHVEALELGEIPEHLLVLGGGYVGLELAQAMRRFGSRVTVIERNERLVHREDLDVSEGITTLFADEGIEVETGVTVLQVRGVSGERVELRARRSGDEIEISGSHLLVATGRMPNTEGMGLELASVELTERGYVRVNERLQTTADGVWAMGDCAGSPQFTHVAYDDFRVVRSDLSGGSRTTKGRLVPFCMFTDPEFARVGLSETEATELGIRYRLLRVPLSSVLRTRTIGETRGFMKALIEADGDRVLGFTVFGAEAGETIAAVQVAMMTSLPYTALRDAVLTHPTMAEGLVVLFSATAKMATVERNSRA